MSTILEPQVASDVPFPDQILNPDWRYPEAIEHEFLAIACPEEEGGFSIFAAHIPGVISEGETEEEARDNIKEAFIATLEACRKRGQPLPYSVRQVVDSSKDCRHLWIKFNE